MNWILENWQGFASGGTLAFIIKHFLNKKQNNQLLKSGDIDNDIKEVKLLKETISVYKEVNKDLKLDALEYKKIIKEQNETIKNYEKLETKINALFTSLAVEKEKSEYLTKENDKLKQKNTELEQNYETLKGLYQEIKKELEQHKKETK
jgi:predicted nuclease with TOPRIM domain